MITEDTIKQTKFYLGEDGLIYLVTGVRSVKQIKLINCIDGTESTPLLFGDDLCRTFVPVILAFEPFIENQDVAQLPVRSKPVQPANNAHKSHKSTSKKKKSNRNTSQYQGVERLKPNKSGKVKFKASWWNGKTKKNIYLGTHDSELMAAAAFQDQIGNKAEAVKLRAQAKQQAADNGEQQENNPDRPLDGADRRNLKRQGKTIYVCKRCGTQYKSKGICGCGCDDMREVPAENNKP